MVTQLTAWADEAATWASPTSAWAYPGVTRLNPKFEWSPSTNPGASPVWVDITDYVLDGSITRGRQSEFDRTSAGRLSLTLDNRDRLFDPENNAQAKPNKRVRVSVGTGADVLPLFDGWIDALPQEYDPPNDATVSLSATDAFKLFARFELDEVYGPAVLADAPVAWWRLADDLPIATSATDASGNGHDGTWRGAPSSTGSLIADGPGAVSLDGESDGAFSAALVSSTPVTIEAWVKTGKYGLNHGFICGQTHEIGGSNPQFIRDVTLTMDNDTGVAEFSARMAGESNITVTGTTVLRDTGVHHIVGTIASDRKLRLYVDGTQEGGTSAAFSGTALDNSGRFRIGRPPTNNETGAGDTYKPFKGDMCEVAVYSSALSAARVLAHYQAGATPWANDTTGGRVARILNLVGWRSADRTIETGSSTLGPVRNTAGRAALDHLLAVEETEQGRVFVTGAGKVAFYGRAHETTEAVVASFDEADYVDLMFDYSDSNLINDCVVTRDGGLPQRATDSGSIAAYWRASESMSGLLYSTDNEALAMAQWRVSNFSDPTMRPTGLTFVPLADLPDLFPRVLARELGDRIEVTRTPPSGSSFTVDAVIEGITHRFDRREWFTSWNLSPLIFGTFGPGGGGGATYLKLNDATLGQLNSNRLGF